jgi:hypothetical protein
MKIFYIIIVLMLVSCAPRVKEQKALLSKETLVSKVVNDLRLDPSRTHTYDVKSSFISLPETLLVLAEEEAMEGRERYTSHIVIVNSITGKIANYFSENATENGWVSDAIFIDEIYIDDTPYELSKTKSAFGIIVRFKSSSPSDPYTEESLSLFVKDGKTLTKVLDSYTIYESLGEVNTAINTCDANFKILHHQLSETNSKTNGYYDIKVHRIHTNRIFGKDDKGLCYPTEIEVAKTEILLKFNGKVYQ